VQHPLIVAPAGARASPVRFDESGAVTSTSVAGTVLALVGLVLVLGFAVVRPRGLPEAVAAAPVAVLIVAGGLVPWRSARAELVGLAPTLAFLAAILALAELARRHRVFEWAGSVMARAARGSARRLLVAVFTVAALTTAALSLDATVVLLTPVVLTAAAAVGARSRPGVYASTHLANSASTLLPVSNLTNLLALSASGLTFAGFASLMAAPWLVTIIVELGCFLLFFRSDLATPAHSTDPRVVPPPRFALTVIAVTLVGFGLAEPLGVPIWAVALAAVVVLAVGPVRAEPRVVPGALLRAANPAFLLFVPALGVVVLAVRAGPVGAWIADLVPHRTDLLGLLAMAGLAALVANLLNNLPATLVLVPLAAHSPALVLAALLGLNIGPNLTYVGSLATLLWRQVLHGHGRAPSAGVFVRLGLVTVPLALAAAVVALWISLRIGGVR
jgi:arsenical pump membrane protein